MFVKNENKMNNLHLIFHHLGNQECSRCIMSHHFSNFFFYKVWERADDFIPERFHLESPVPNETNTDFRYLITCNLFNMLLSFNIFISSVIVVESFSELIYLVSYICLKYWILISAYHRFIPFSGGPRKCVGDQFALLEAIVGLAVFVQRLNFELVPDQNIGMTTGATIHTSNVSSFSIGLT